MITNWQSMAAAVVLLAGTIVVSASAAPKTKAVPEDSVPRDLLYLSDDGLMVIRLHVVVDGKSLDRYWRENVDKLFANLDENNDDALTGAEMARIPSVQQLRQAGVIGDSPAGAVSRGADTMPRDGRVTRDELADYLKKSGGGSLGITTAANSNQLAYSSSGQIIRGQPNIQLFQRLDQDGDEKLTSDEFNLTTALRKLDVDDDELLAAAEIMPFQNPYRSVQRISREQAQNQLPTFMSLENVDSPTQLIRQLLERYDREETKQGSGGKNNKLSAAELGLSGAAIEPFDADADGQLDFDELRQWLRRPEPNVTIVFRVGDSAQRGIQLSANEKTTSQKIKSHASSQGAAALVVGAVQLDLVAEGGGEWKANNAAAAYKSRFDAADADNNGYLDAEESRRIGALRIAFDLLDDDKDGKVFFKEVESYVDRFGAIAQSRTVLNVNEQGRQLFQVLDINRDGRVSARELAAGNQRIAEWDNDGDAALSEKEIPTTWRLTLGRGQLAISGATIRVAAAPQPGMTRNLTPNTAPVWFQKMDRNGDGEVSRREFLGSSADFQKLDANGDGLLVPDESNNSPNK